MRHLNKLFVAIAISLLGQYATAQPPARKREKAEQQKNTAAYNVPMSERAKSQYPKTETPEDVVWKRDIYRVLDLNKEKNASLYYPVQPIGDQMNLFTFIFNHIIDNSIVAYEYSMDGYENFTPEKIIDPKQMLDDQGILYETEEEGGKIVVNASDIPSNQVLSYYIKESYYYDQRTSTYNQRVTAICPVWHKSGEFTTEVTKFPMFWLKYDEIATLLARQTVMSSSYNNVSTMSLDDYFTKNCYDGEIYKTVNLRNLAISQYCKDSTEIKKEQQKIEKQLDDFHANLWTTVKPVANDSVATDSTAVASDKESKKKISARKEKSKKQVKEKKSSSSKSSSSPRVSVRRQRR